MNDIIPSIHGAVMRGTTPTIIYDLVFDVSEVTSLKMYFMQGNKVMFTKELSDCTAEEGLIYTQLTQEDTYKLSAKKRLEIRCRFKRNDSPVVGTIASYVDVIDSGKPEMELDPQPVPPVPTKPAYIVITVLPDKLRYEDGDDISIDGIEVRAYYEDDTEWGIVPFEELTFSPTTAVESDIWTDGDGLNAIRIQYTRVESTGRYCYKGQLGTCDIFSVVYGTYPATVGSDGAADLFLTRYNDKVYACGISGSLGFNIYGYLDGVFGYEGEYVWIAMTSFIPPIGRFEEGTWHEYLTDIPTSTKNPTTVNPNALYFKEDVTVSWDRGDGTILTDDYEIRVGDDIWTDGDGVYALKLSCYTVTDQDGHAPYIRSDVIGKTSLPESPSPYDNVYVGTEVESTILITRYDGYIYAKLIGEDPTRLRPVYQIPYHESFYYYGNYNLGAINNVQFYRQWSFPAYADVSCVIPVSTSDPTQAGDLHPL